MEEELRQYVGEQVKITLIASSGGVFEVVADKRLVFSKKSLGRFPDQGEVCRLLEKKTP